MNTGALNDLERIANYLFDNAPERAPNLVRSINDAPVILLKFPQLGRQGKKNGTREFVHSSLPYVLVYRVTGDAIQIVRILHAAQRWP